MILSASYEGEVLSGSTTDFNPYFGTDVGICSIIKPQIIFNASLSHLPFWKKLFEVGKRVLVTKREILAAVLILAFDSPGLGRISGH